MADDEITVFVFFSKADGMSSGCLFQIQRMADREEAVDVVFMDPPRSGSSPDFLKSLLVIRPKKIVYISCEPETQARDLKTLKKDYKVEAIQPVDMFPFTEKCETVVLLTRKE